MVFKITKFFLQGKKVVPCRHDWHQTGGEVTISVYAKNSLPELSQVEANSTLVSILSNSIEITLNKLFICKHFLKSSYF